MNWDDVETDWKQVKGYVKRKWGKLTDADMDAIAGRRDQLRGQLQKTYGLTEDQAEVQVRTFEALHKVYPPTKSA